MGQENNLNRIYLQGQQQQNFVPLPCWKQHKWQLFYFLRRTMQYYVWLICNVHGACGLGSCQTCSGLDRRMIRILKAAGDFFQSNTQLMLKPPTWRIRRRQLVGPFTIDLPIMIESISFQRKLTSIAGQIKVRGLPRCVSLKVTDSVVHELCIFGWSMQTFWHNLFKQMED